MVQYAREGLNELIDDGVDYCSVMNKKRYDVYKHTLDAALQIEIKKSYHCHYTRRKGASVYSANTHFHLVVVVLLLLMPMVR
jgi:hypothetical protein